MNFVFLPYGTWGVVCAALISFVAGALLFGLVHVWGKREHWSHALTIGWTWLATMVLTASIDAWHLLYLGIVPLESPVTIARVLAPIHDPDTLGVRVVCEFIGVSAGVMVGWLVWTGAWRHARQTGHDHPIE